MSLLSTSFESVKRTLSRSDSSVSMGTHIRKIFPNPVAGHRKHHQPSETCYKQLEDLKKEHYLANLTESGEKDGFLKKILHVDSKLRQANEEIATSKKNITDLNVELKETKLYSLREILRLKIKLEQKALKKLKDKKRLLKGDVYTLTRPENKVLFTMREINGTLEANRQKTISKDKTIPRVCAYLGGLVGAVPATILAGLASRGISVPLPVIVGSTFLGSGGGTLLGLILEKPFRRIRKKFL